MKTVSIIKAKAVGMYGCSSVKITIEMEHSLTSKAESLQAKTRMHNGILKKLIDDSPYAKILKI